MIVDLIALEKSPFAFRDSIAPQEIDLESEGVSLKSSVVVEGELTKRIMQADVEGEITTDAEIECNRCLQPVATKLQFPFKVSYVAPENYPEARETELREDDLEIAVLEDTKIDVTELVREQILLNLPAQVFCREECKGLCEKCGANRNLVNCNCEDKEIDPRWAALKNLK